MFPSLRKAAEHWSSSTSDLDFNLMRWFSVTALLSVATVSILASLALSTLFEDRMVRQEVEITAGFVRSIVATENAYAVFDGTATLPLPQLTAIFTHMTRMPDVVRTNVYSPDKRIIWSSDAKLIGQVFASNDELDEALNAQLVVHSGIVNSQHLPKSEHQDFDSGVVNFVESYVPILDAQSKTVIGVVELYKIPRDVFEAIHAGHRLIWGGALAAGLFLYGALFWIIRRAHAIIERQREQLIESEAMAVVGEMGSAVAHGLRNPLATIRSSAELALGDDVSAETRECAEDIVAQVDRLEDWIRRLLTYAKPALALIESVDINAVLEESLAAYIRDLERRKIVTRLELSSALPPVRGEAATLVQLIGSLIANASEAIRDEGEIVLRSRLDSDGVIVEVADNGPGMSVESVGKAFKPYFTTKQKGLGLGLPLVRRLIERFGGRVDIDSSPSQGTRVRLHLLPHIKSGDAT